MSPLLFNINVNWHDFVFFWLSRLWISHMHLHCCQNCDTVKGTYRDIVTAAYVRASVLPRIHKNQSKWWKFCQQATLKCLNKDSTVSVVTRLHAGWLTHCCLTVSRAERFVSSAKHFIPALLLLFSEYKQVSPQRWPGRHESNHSPPPNAKVKNIWSYNSTPNMHLHDARRNTFSITRNDSLNM